MVEDVFSKISLVNSTKFNKNSMQQRSLILFDSAIKSPITRQYYIRYLTEFRDFFIIKSYDDLIGIKPKKLQEMLENFVMYQRKRNLGLSCVNSKLSALKLFFAMNDIVALNWIKLSKMKPEKKKLTGDKPYTTEDIEEILQRVGSHLKFRCIIHIMSASGIRIGAFAELKLKHIQDMPNGCKSILVYDDDKAEYTTFIHPEAVEALDQYLAFRAKSGEIITPESWLIPSKHDSNVVAILSSLRTQMARYVHQDDEVKKRGRYEKQTNHAFRKRFDTILKSNHNVNINLAEKMMGHSTTIPLDNVYFKPAIDQLFDEYQKAIPELIIDDKYRLREQLKKKDEKINELIQKDNEIDVLKNTILEIKNNMLEIQNKIKL